MGSDCVFCRIVEGHAPASMVYRDSVCCAFMDIRPINVGHVLVIPLQHAAGLSDLPAAAGAHMFRIGQRIAAALRRSGHRCQGINLFLADGQVAGQEVFHVHLHVIPRYAGDGFGLRFGPLNRQPTSRSELEEAAMRLRAALAALPDAEK